MVSVPAEVIDGAAADERQVFAVLLKNQGPDDRLVQLALGLHCVEGLVLGFGWLDVASRVILQGGVVTH